jgi:hypothetical protein
LRSKCYLCLLRSFISLKKKIPISPPQSILRMTKSRKESTIERRTRLRIQSLVIKDNFNLKNGIPHFLVRVSFPNDHNCLPNLRGQSFHSSWRTQLRRSCHIHQFLDDGSGYRQPGGRRDRRGHHHTEGSDEDNC